MAALFSPKSRLKFIMKFIHPDVDHIDPRWKEGRDYQLVCGLDCPLNYCERDSKFNTAKSNRFLPWRVANDEVGTVPVEQGDLCLFLVGADIEQDIPGEWVLMEFLGEEWFAATRHLVGGLRALDEYRRENSDWSHRLFEWQNNNPGVTTQLQWKYYANNPDKLKERNKNVGEGVKRRNAANPELLVQVGIKSKAAKLKRFQCTVTGKISSDSGLTKYQKNRGIDTSNRVELY